MSPRMAQKLVPVLMVASFLLALFIVTYAIKYTVDRFVSAPSPQKPFPLTMPMKDNTSSTRPPFEETMSACWKADILEEKPPKDTTPPVAQTLQPPPPAVKLNYTLMGIAAHPDPEKGYAMLLIGNQQVLVKVGATIPDTVYKVIEITPDCVKISCGQVIVTLEREKPWLALQQGEQSISETLAMQDNRIVVINCKNLAGYGLQEHDQIVSVAGQRIQSLEELRHALEQETRAVTDISILREGRIVSLVLPRTTSRLLYGEQE